MRKLSKEEFIERSKIIHGDKYDYSLVEYKNFKEKVEIICKKCNNKFLQVPNSHLSGSGCSYCSGKIINISNCLNTTNTDLCKELKFIEDGLKYSYGSHKKVWWVCNKCGFEWRSSISNRVKGRGCPSCYKSSKSYISSNCKGIKKLIETHPDLCKDLKNHELSYELSKGSRRVVSWVCSLCGYKWDRSVKESARKKVNCPECSRRCLSFKKTISETHKKLCEELKYKKDSERYSYGSTKKVWWVCSKCNHEWKASIDKRTISNRGCPTCAAQRNLVGRREEQLLNLLKPHFENLKSQHRIGKYSVDFSIVNNNNSHILVLEYDEEDHYKHINNPKSNYYLPLQIKRQNRIIKTLKKSFQRVSFIRIPDQNPEGFENDLEDVANYLRTYLKDFLTNPQKELITSPEQILNLFPTDPQPIPQPIPQLSF